MKQFIIIIILVGRHSAEVQACELKRDDCGYDCHLGERVIIYIIISFLSSGNRAKEMSSRELFKCLL